MLTLEGPLEDATVFNQSLLLFFLSRDLLQLDEDWMVFYSVAWRSITYRQTQFLLYKCQKIRIQDIMQGVRNVIVTGSNKGIGQGIAENLAGKGWNVIMAVRNLALGEEARNKILAKYPHANLHLEHLDVSDFASIASFVPLIQQKYKTVDVLINNAGVAAKGDAFDSEVVKFTFDTNFYGTVELTEKILPLIVDNGKIITVGSSTGRMTFQRIGNQQLKDRWRKQAITKDQLLHLVHQFEDAVKDQTYAEKGWPKWSYGVSKLAINVYASVIGKSDEATKRGIQIYACCPGYVNTDMTSHKGILTVEQGILTPIFLAQLPFELKEELQGGFFYEQKKVSLFE